MSQGQTLMLKRHGMVRLTFLFNNDNKITEIPIIRIRPNKAQPRKQFDEASLTSLSQSITENGILQPLTVRRASQSEYELIAGERRLRASVMAGLKKVPCIIVKCSDKESAIFALLENLQRSDLGVFEEARGISRLIRRFGLTQEEAAQRLGKTQSTIANKLLIISAGLTERHARALLRIEDEGKRREVLSKVIALNLNTQQTDNLVGEVLNDCPKHIKSMGSSKAVIKDVRIFVNTINKAVDTMRLAGIDAKAVKSENNNYIEYTIKIPKKTASDNKSA